MVYNEGIMEAQRDFSIPDIELFKLFMHNECISYFCDLTVIEGTQLINLINGLYLFQGHCLGGKLV